MNGYEKITHGIENKPCGVLKMIMQKNKRNILIVEDEQNISSKLKELLAPYGRVYMTHSKDDALSVLSKVNMTHAFVDLDLQDDLDGLDVISRCKRLNIKTSALTCHESDQIVESCLELGVGTYFDKISFFESPDKTLEKFFGIQNLNSERIDYFFEHEYFTTDKSVRESVEFILSNDFSEDRSILLLGPTGTGKSKLARLLHDEISTGPFIHFNVNTCQEGLVESKLFGHVKGSFTSSTEDQKGYFQLAEGGTLFLDEIGDMSPSMQKMLLTAIENNDYRPLGSSKALKRNFRLICAGNNILEKVKEGKFREDLLYRIMDRVLRLKPLNQRKNDIEIQAKKFANEFSKQQGKGHVKFSDEAMNLLKDYEWKGNSRDLRNEIRNVIDFIEHPIITEDDLPNKFKQTRSSILNEIILTDEQCDFIEENGVKKFIESMKILIAQKYYFDNGSNKYQAMKSLKASKTIVNGLIKNYTNFQESRCQ